MTRILLLGHSYNDLNGVLLVNSFEDSEFTTISIAHINLEKNLPLGSDNTA